MILENLVQKHVWIPYALKAKLFRRSCGYHLGSLSTEKEEKNLRFSNPSGYKQECKLFSVLVALFACGEKLS